MTAEVPDIQPVDEIAIVRQEETVPGLAATKPDPATGAVRRRQILSQIPPDTWNPLSPEKRSSRRRC
jgi:hypothetical protein